ASPTMRWGNSGARSASNSRRRERATGSSSTIRIDGASGISASSLFAVGEMDDHAELTVGGRGLELAFDVESQVEPLAHVRQRHVIARTGGRGIGERVGDLDPHAIAALGDRDADFAWSLVGLDAVMNRVFDQRLQDRKSVV